MSTSSRLAMNMARLWHFPRIQRIRPQRYRTCSDRALSASASCASIDYGPNRLNHDHTEALLDAETGYTEAAGSHSIDNPPLGLVLSASATGRDSRVRLLETCPSFTAFRSENFSRNKTCEKGILASEYFLDCETAMTARTEIQAEAVG